MKFFSRFLFTSTLALASCGGPSDSLVPSSIYANQDPSYPELQPLTVGPEVGCSQLVEDFCEKLHDPTRQGNANLQVGRYTVPLRFGVTRQRIPVGEENFFRAQLFNRQNLPAEFLSQLESSNYFSELSDFLRTKDYDDATADEAERIDSLERNVRRIWSDSLARVRLERLMARYPNYLKVKKKPLAWRLERNRIEAQLKADIYKAVWTGSPFWKQVENDFGRVKKAYLEFLAKEGDLPANAREWWMQTISTIELVTPGSRPSMPMEECATQAINAYYLPSQHLFTVCAGLMGNGEILATIAHEMSHSLGVSNRVLRHLRESTLGKHVQALQKSVCEKASSARTCPPEWQDLLNNLPADLQNLKGGPDLFVPKFLSCLQYNAETVAQAKPSEAYLEQMAGSRARQSSGAFADRKYYLHLTHEQAVAEDGTESPNPLFLNPCADSDFYQANYQPDDPYNLPIFMTASFLCQDPKKAFEARLDASASDAEAVQGKILAATIPLGGSFSKDDAMTSALYSEDSEERFADAMGYRVLAQILEQTAATERVPLYLANMASDCQAPSLETKFPSHAQAEKKHSLEAHSSGKQRREEGEIGAIRKLLGCKRDLSPTIKDCWLKGEEKLSY